MTNAFKLGNIDIGKIPIVMGVINVSPESFYDLSVASTDEQILKLAEKHIADGAKVLDIGAQSTAPVSIYGKDNQILPLEEEKRVLNAIKIIQDEFAKIDISVDTQRKEVALKALDAGATIINDISGFKNEKAIVKAIADYDGSAIAMAAKKMPGDIWKPGEIIQEFKKSIDIATSAGVSLNKIILDPGIGSWNGRDYNHDYSILKELNSLKILGHPLLLGISRKTFIGKVLDSAAPKDRLNGTIAATCWALERGISIIRTHDTKSIVDSIKILSKLGAFD